MRKALAAVRRQLLLGKIWTCPLVRDGNDDRRSIVGEGEISESSSPTVNIRTSGNRTKRLPISSCAGLESANIIHPPERDENSQASIPMRHA